MRKRSKGENILLSTGSFPIKSKVTRYSDLAAAESVYTRSLSCDLAWPSYSSISQEELDLPLAYVITVFSDPRNIELTLATAFRPHNSYCLHVDPKSDNVFRYDL